MRVLFLFLFSIRAQAQILLTHITHRKEHIEIQVTLPQAQNPKKKNIAKIYDTDGYLTNAILLGIFLKDKSHSKHLSQHLTLAVTRMKKKVIELFEDNMEGLPTEEEWKRRFKDIFYDDLNEKDRLRVANIILLERMIPQELEFERRMTEAHYNLASQMIFLLNEIKKDPEMKENGLRYSWAVFQRILPELFWVPRYKIELIDPDTHQKTIHWLDYRKDYERDWRQVFILPSGFLDYNWTSFLGNNL